MKDKGKELSSESEQERCGDAKLTKASSSRRLKSVDISDYKLFQEEQRTTQIVYSYKGGKKVPKLREPRNLFAFNEEKKLQPPRWPAEVKVLNVRPRFIDYTPKEPEPFWREDSGSVNTNLRKTADESGQLVYDNPPGSDKYFVRSCVGGSTIPKKPFYKLQSPDDDTLIFESRFESGNLKRAIKVGAYEYQLWMRTDLYTIKHTQWFFFRVRNTKPGVTYQFSIMNFIKSNSLYNNGMQPLFYSEMNAYKSKIGWVRKGDDVKYYKNDIRREDTNKDCYHYSLAWAIQFNYANDTCYFAHCYPYTYSDLQEYLMAVRNDPIKTRLCKQRVLCRTLCGNFVYILTITNPSRRPADAESKRAVVITARVHPGETNSSWMMKGLLDFLISNNPDAKLLRDTFVFKIVPMINPDGVIVGNYRCSLTGRDLNRNYRTSFKDSYPPIWHIKSMIKKLLEEREIVMYCDFHGHSRKQNVFIYGCDNKKNPLARLRERIFPMMMAKNAPCKFSYKGCKFKVQKSKQGTGRVVMWNLGITNSYTMEATFCGSSLGTRNGFHFNTVDLEAMGYHLCDTLLDYCDPDDTKYIMLLRELEEKFKAEILERMKKNGTAAPSMTVADIDIDANYTSDLESSTGGSDSSVSDGLPMHLIHAPHVIQYHQHPKKKKLRSRKERNKRRAKAMKIKDVLITDAPKPETESEVKMSYKKHAGTNHTSRPKHDVRCSPKHDQHNAACCPTTPMRLCREHAANNKGADYLEAVTNAYMLSGMLVSDNKTDVPHLRYTAGSNYLSDIQGGNRRGSTTRWSTDSGGGGMVKQPSDEEEGNFTVSYLAKQLEKSTDCTIPRSRSDARLSSAAFDLARKITMYNSRYKMESSQQAVPADHDVPFIRPSSPSQLWSNPTWKRAGKILSSTKAHLHLQPKQNQSTTDLRTNNDSTKSKLSRSVLTSKSGTWSENDMTPEVAMIRPRKNDDKKMLYRGRPELPKKHEMQTAKVSGMFNKEAHSEPMKKYTGYTGGHASHAEKTSRRQPEQLEEKKATSNDTACLSSFKPASNTTTIMSATSNSNSLVQPSPFYVALPVDTLPIQVKSRHGMLGSPPDLKAPVIDASEEPGKLISYALQRQNQQSHHELITSDNISGTESNEDDDVGPFISKFSKLEVSPLRRESTTHSNFIMTVEPNNISENPMRRLSSPKRRSSNLSPVSAGVIHIGKHSDEDVIAEHKKDNPSVIKATKNSPPSSGGAPSKISLTFQTGLRNPESTNTVKTFRRGPFIPHFKRCYKNHR